MDLSQLSDSDLMALQAKDLSKVSNKGLQHLQNYSYTGDIPTPMSAKTQSAPNNSKLVNFLSGGRSGNWEQYLYNNEPPADSFLGRAGQLLDASGITGLAPEVSPLGGITRLTSVNKAKLAAENAANSAKNSTVAKKLGDLLSSAGSAVGSIPKRLLAFESQRDPEAFNTIYQAYKQNIPELKQAINEATPLGKELYNDMVYNYARKLQVPHDVAILAEDYTRGHPQGLGAWDLLTQHYKDLPVDMPAAVKRAQMPSYRPFEQLTDAERLKQATQAGVDTAVFNPVPAKTGVDDIANIAMTLGKKAILPSIAQPLAALSSPRVARMAAILAGQGANVSGKVGDAATRAVNMLPQASLEDLINAGILDARTMRANQGEQ
jgi:hypothetical protein